MKKLPVTLLLLAMAAMLPRPASAQEKPWMQYITPSGYFQTGFSSDHNFNNSFYIKRARVALSGKLYQDPNYGTFEYKVQAELAGSPKLVDYFFKYTICDEFGIQLGQFKTPLSIENSEYAPLKLEMIDYSLLVQRFCRMGADVTGVNSTGREMGLQFYGKLFKLNDGHSLVRYEAAVFNGGGINKMDEDRRKDFMARLMIYPIKDLSLAGYYVRSLGPVDKTPPFYRDYDYFIYDRYGGGFAYDGKHAWFRAEYMAGHTEGYRGEGAYGTIGAKIRGKGGFGARYDYFTFNSREAGHVQQYITVGGFLYPFPRLRIQLNYMYKMDPGVEPVHLVNLMTSIIL